MEVCRWLDFCCCVEKNASSLWTIRYPERRLDVHFLMEALGYPQLEQVCFWTWRERLPVESLSISLCPSLPVYMSRRRQRRLLSSWPMYKFPLSPRIRLFTYRSDGTERASCCGACRKTRYPWLQDCVSITTTCAGSRDATHSF